MTTYVFHARGIGERVGSGLLMNIMRKLPKDEFKVIEIEWPASYGPVPNIGGMNFIDSLNWLYGNTVAAIRHWVEPGDEYLLVGYSGGAEGMGNLVAGNNLIASTHWFETTGCIGVVLIADPSMPRMAVGNTRRYGIRGSRDIKAKFPVLWLADPDDAIPLCEPKPSPLRVLADATPALSLGARALCGHLSADKMRKIPPQEYIINIFDLQATKRRYEIAAQQLYGYLQGGAHTSYSRRIMRGMGMTYTDYAANWIRRQAF